MVLKLSKQDWVAHSTSRNEPGLVTWRQTVAFPVKYKNNTDLEKKVYFSKMTKSVYYIDQLKIKTKKTSTFGQNIQDRFGKVKAMKSSPLLGPFCGSEFWGFSLLKI